jgi:hypothetical protein
MSEMRTRALLVVLGGVLMLYGGWLVLTRQDPGQWLEIVVWLAAGIVAHDVVLSGLVIALGVVGSRLLPRPWRAPATVALIVWGTLTIASIPVLSGLGVRADNPTLLDRPYVATWSLISAIVVLAVVVAGFVRARAQVADEPSAEG